MVYIDLLLLWHKTWSLHANTETSEFWVHVVIQKDGTSTEDTVKDGTLGSSVKVVQSMCYSYAYL